MGTERLYELTSIFLISSWHCFMPGHFKTLLVANWVTGMNRRQLVLMASGYGVSHGILTGFAIIAGILFSKYFSMFLEKSGFYLGNFYLIVLLGAFIYFSYKSFNLIQEHKTGKDNCGCSACSAIKNSENKPFWTGILLGFVPCSGTIGLMLIGAALLDKGGSIVLTFLMLWAGIFFTMMLIAIVLTYIPIKKVSGKFPDWLPFAVAAVFCVIIFIWRSVVLWQDISFLY